MFPPAGRRSHTDTSDAPAAGVCFLSGRLKTNVWRDSWRNQVFWNAAGSSHPSRPGSPESQRRGGRKREDTRMDMLTCYLMLLCVVLMKSCDQSQELLNLEQESSKLKRRFITAARQHVSILSSTHPVSCSG